MPIYEYVQEDGTRVELIHSWPPPKIEGATLVPSAAAFRMQDTEAVLAAQGLRVSEPGVERDIERIKQDKIRKQDEERRKVIADVLADHTL